MLNEKWNVPFWLCLSTLTVAALHAQAQPGAPVIHKPASQAEVVEGGAEMPEVIRSGEFEQLLFVAAEKLALPSGTLDPTFSEVADTILPVILKSPVENDCLQYEPFSSHDDPPRGVYDLDTALDHADNVMVAQVTGRRFGFIPNRPGMLLRISAVAFLKGEFPRSEHYLFYAAGDFTLGSQKICVQDVSFGPPPELGDRVLILFTNRRSNFESEFLNANALSIFVLKEGQPVILPRFYRERDPQLKAHLPKDFIERVVDMIKEGAE